MKKFPPADDYVIDYTYWKTWYGLAVDEIEAQRKKIEELERSRETLLNELNTVKMSK
jgi:hypothetical protein